MTSWHTNLFLLEALVTLKKFERLLKGINPKLRVRQRGFDDVGGLFVGLSGKGGYIARITKGELHLNGYRFRFSDPTRIGEYTQGNIQKRGRKTLVNLLRNYRWITKKEHISSLTWGIDYGLRNGKS